MVSLYSNLLDPLNIGGMSFAKGFLYIAGRHDVGSLAKNGRQHSQTSSIRSQRSGRLSGYTSAA